MARVLIIGCGGVASVAIHKCCQNSEVFDEIMIASRTVSNFLQRPKQRYQRQKSMPITWMKS